MIGFRLGPLYGRVLLVLFVILCLTLVLQIKDDRFNDLEDILTNRLDRALEGEILRELKMQVPGLGDYGQAVTLKGEAAEKADKDIATLSLNEELSKRLSYNRKPPDPRHALCKAKEATYKNLPTASVIIVFFNEPFSVLMRTVHSVLNTVVADPNVLNEIILVDDGSDLRELQAKLEYYINTRLPKKVKLLRLPQRYSFLFFYSHQSTCAQLLFGLDWVIDNFIFVFNKRKSGDE